MQYYSGDWKLGIKSKSNMAEFSSNPDERLKSEISYAEHQKRQKNENDHRMKNRIEVNKKRYENNLDTFTNQNEFEELIDSCNLEGHELFEFLIKYKKDDDA